VYVAHFVCPNLFGTSYIQQVGQPSQKLNVTTTPTDKESCEVLGGKWGRIGLSLEEGCNLPPSDAGKECSDSDECEGSCIAELSEEEWENAIHGVVYTKGKCTAWKITVGCRDFVENGKVEGILCVD